MTNAIEHMVDQLLSKGYVLKPVEKPVVHIETKTSRKSGQRLTEEEKLEILQCINLGWSVRKINSTFHVSYRTIVKIKETMRG